MSEVDKEKEEDDKKNTDLWKMKQEEKKRKKEETGCNEKKEKKKKEKEEKKQLQEKGSEKKEGKKEEKTAVKVPEVKQPEVAPQPPAPLFHKLTKIDKLLSSKQRQSQIFKDQLISKQMDQSVSQIDTVLYVGSKSRLTTKQQIHVKEINNCEQAELTCRYSDLSYFFEGSLTKIFIQAEFIFSNGSVLARQGALNVALMGHYYKIPVIVVGGSWLFNGWRPLNFEALTERYGEDSVKGLDWIEQKYLKSTILEVGMINPHQMSMYPPIIYKQLNLKTQQW